MKNSRFKYFINLTSGIELLNIVSPGSGVMFVRIQSTHCEQKLWDRVLMELDNNFLLWCSLGYTCVVMDCGSRKRVSRALWQGIPWIRYALTRSWFRRCLEDNYVNGHECSEYFSKVYEQLPSVVLNRLGYFRKFLTGDKVDIVTVSCWSEHDGDYFWYRNKLEEICGYG